MSRIEFPPWHGEFGWEVASWVPSCRAKAKGCDEVIASSFEAMAPLYADFVTEFRAHDGKGRGLNYPKQYRPKPAEYFKYGNAGDSRYSCKILVHARGIRRKANINYRRFLDLTMLLPQVYTVGWIGTAEDDYIPCTGLDLRGLELQALMDLIARAKIVVGVSSGIMHLAAACGTSIVTWGDRRTYFGETLEQRYKITWNPFNVRVGWLNADNWQPEPDAIIEKIKEILDYETDSAEKHPAAVG